MLRCSQGLEFILDTLKEHVTRFNLHIMHIHKPWLFICLCIYLFIFKDFLNLFLFVKTKLVLEILHYESLMLSGLKFMFRDS